MEKGITVYFDKEADYLEVNFEKALGYYRETGTEAVMEKVAAEDERVIGFSILNVSQMSAIKPLSVQLAA